MKTIDRSRLKKLQQREEARFIAEHPKSAELYKRAQNSLLGGVPMSWMKKWAGAFPIFVQSARGAHFTDVDQHDYVDLCLGDTGAMTGHSPDVVAEAVARRARDGITLMLPTEDALWVGEDLKRRFGLPYWQFTLTATDANRFSIRIAREITQRSKILVFHYCYHGTVDESFASLREGVVGPRRGNIGPPVNPAETTRVVEFNDLNALEDALKHHDVACVLAEPAMTNVGIILPEDGYWKSARDLCRRYGSILIADETHTICAGPGGCTAEWKLDTDMLVFGKAIGSGIPGAAYGCSEEVAQRISARIHLEDCDVGGIGGTLAGNALSLVAMRATLEHVLTPAAFAKMIPLAKRFDDGVAEHIRSANLPWNVIRLGARAEYTFAAKPPRNGGESAAAADFELERFLHLYALNRGVLLTPFHNMALMCPATTEADIDLHTKIFGEATHELTA
ncbi:MAG TPA: aspartate aminotransferase family protein [Candidatus Acidoferrum sp.]|nr:aspartate aminotransferase family protein [Methylomirabilota bacterium]HUK30516.1 aspartate aminotransferase family protein [Candidatus Acidoferrum sp.]